MRALAATLVVVTHAIQQLGTELPPGTISDETYRITGLFGGLGVYAFFVISGFIMVVATPSARGVRPALIFLARRWIRIVPIYWIATTVAALLLWKHSGGQEPDAMRIVQSLFFIPYVQGPGVVLQPLVGQGWTLEYEMFFYALFGACLLLPRWRYPTLAVGLLGLVAIGPAFASSAETSVFLTIAVYLVAPIILLFGAGVLLGVARDRWAVVLPVPQYVSWLPLGFVIAIFALFGTDNSDGRVWSCIFYLACTAAVGLAVFCRSPARGWLTVALVSVWDASYSLYLFHNFFLIVAKKIWVVVMGASGTIVFTGLATAGCVVGALVIHHLIEKPLTRNLMRPVARLARSETPKALIQPASS